MLKLVIFDLDQTLVNTMHRFYILFNDALSKFGCKSVTWEAFIEKYKEDNLSTYICTENRIFWDYFLSHFNDRECTEDSLIHGTSSVLSELKKNGLIIVIVTGRMVPASSVWEELEKFDIAKYVDYVYTRNDNYCDGFRRTELILKAMKKFDACPEETVLVADYWPDMQSGREAGVFTVGVLTGHVNKRQLLENGANRIIPSVAELMPVLTHFFH